MNGYVILKDADWDSISDEDAYADADWQDKGCEDLHDCISRE